MYMVCSFREACGYIFYWEWNNFNEKMLNDDNSNRTRRKKGELTRTYVNELSRDHTNKCVKT